MSDKKVYCNECDGMVYYFGSEKCKFTVIDQKYIYRDKIVVLKPDNYNFCICKNMYGDCEHFIKKIVVPKQSLLEKLYKLFRR